MPGSESASAVLQQRAEKNLPVPTNPPAYDRPVQMWLYIVGCGVMGVPWFLWQWLSVAGKRYRLDDDGTLTYAFIETVKSMHPFYVIRLLGGLLFLGGTLVMCFNLYRTVAGARPVTAPIPAPVLAH